MPFVKKILSNGSKPKKYPYEQVAFTTATTTAKTNLQRTGNIIEKGAFKKYSWEQNYITRWSCVDLLTFVTYTEKTGHITEPFRPVNPNLHGSINWARL